MKFAKVLDDGALRDGMRLVFQEDSYWPQVASTTGTLFRVPGPRGVTAAASTGNSGS